MIKRLLIDEDRFMKSPHPRFTVVFLMTLLASLCATVSAAPDRPNIILIMSDDQGWGQVGYMGHPQLKGNTPNLDAMAKL